MRPCTYFGCEKQAHTTTASTDPATNVVTVVDYCDEHHNMRFRGVVYTSGCDECKVKVVYENPLAQ